MSTISVWSPIATKAMNHEQLASQNTGGCLSLGKYVVFFFNPITNQRIDLPGLPRDECIFDEISFSEAPTSPDCMVLAIHVQPFWVFFSFIRRGEDHWNSDKIYLESGFVPSYSSPVFHEGCFYFLGQTGCLAIFDPNRDEKDELDMWVELHSPGNPCASPIMNCYMVDCNGELMSVFVGHMGQWVDKDNKTASSTRAGKQNIFSKVQQKGGHLYIL
ncbi:hypothetical protein OIU78_029538 [Salix suchowensis]|nr:hypothetical protein OIU78_029538 [Salix suchowensis]